MSNENANTAGDLAQRVAALETLLKTLVTNLARNNGALLEALDTIAEGDRHRVEAVRKCRGIVCEIKPPGCSGGDKDEDDDKDKDE